jgi:hypothetical protein
MIINRYLYLGVKLNYRVKKRLSGNFGDVTVYFRPPAGRGLAVQMAGTHKIRAMKFPM